MYVCILCSITSVRVLQSLVEYGMVGETRQYYGRVVKAVPEEEKKGYYTEARKRANIKYAKENLKRVPLDVQKEEYEKIKAAAEAVGEPVNKYIKTAISRRMESGE